MAQLMKYIPTFILKECSFFDLYTACGPFLFSSKVISKDLRDLGG